MADEIIKQINAFICEGKMSTTITNIIEKLNTYICEKELNSRCNSWVTDMGIVNEKHATEVCKILTSIDGILAVTSVPESELSPYCYIIITVSNQYIDRILAANPDYNAIKTQKAIAKLRADIDKLKEEIAEKELAILALQE